MEGRNVPCATAHTSMHITGSLFEDRGIGEGSLCCSAYITKTMFRGQRDKEMLQHIHYHYTMGMTDEEGNVPCAAAHTLPVHYGEDR